MNLGLSLICFSFRFIEVPTFICDLKTLQSTSLIKQVEGLLRASCINLRFPTTINILNTGRCRCPPLSPTFSLQVEHRKRSSKEGRVPPLPLGTACFLRSRYGVHVTISHFDVNTKTGHASNLKFEAFSISRRIGQCADDQRSLTVRFDWMLLAV